MQRTFAIITVPLLLVVAFGLLAMDTSRKRDAALDQDGAMRIEPGDSVSIVSDQVELKLGKETIVRLEKDTRLHVQEVQGRWVGGTVRVRGKTLNGWVSMRQVKRRDPKAVAATTASAPDSGKEKAQPRSDKPRKQGPDQEAGKEKKTSGETLASKFARMLDQERAMKSPAASGSLGAPAKPASSRGGSSATSDRIVGPDRAAGDRVNGQRPKKSVAMAAAASPSESVAPRTLPRALVVAPLPARPRAAIQVLIARQLEDLSDLDSTKIVGQLVINGDQFTNRSLKHLDGMRILSLSIEAINVSNAGLIHVAGVSDLRELRIWAPSVNDSGLEILAKLDALELLDLEGTSVQGEGLALLAGLKQLRQLTLGPKMDAKHLPLLEALPSLTELDLRPCHRLDATCVESLGRLRNLRTIWLPRQLTAETRSAVRRMLPKCQVRS